MSAGIDTKVSAENEPGPTPERVGPGGGIRSVEQAEALGAASASIGTICGCGAPATAQSGSLRPLPVTVQTIRWPGSTRPASALASRPATDAAEAGSTKTPSCAANSR